VGQSISNWALTTLNYSVIIIIESLGCHLAKGVRRSAHNAATTVSRLTFKRQKYRGIRASHVPDSESAFD
jgi:hypothetical protein